MKMLYFLLLISSTALADEASFLKCRAITDASARLVCYDAIKWSASAPKSDPSDLPQTPERFGLAQPTSKVTLDSIESHIPGRFEGWGPKTTIELANGQVWQISDGSRYTQDIRDPKVKISRGALGAFYLEVEGANGSPRVKRLR